VQNTDYTPDFRKTRSDARTGGDIEDVYGETWTYGSLTLS